MANRTSKPKERGRPSAAPRAKAGAWPSVAGEYHTLCHGNGCCVAVTTLGSALLAEHLAAMRPSGLCIVGKTETENIGVEKVVKNIVTNPGIRYLVVAGKEPAGRSPGATLLALWQNGVDQGMRVIGAPGTVSALVNATRNDVETFRKQVRVVDMMGCDDAEPLADKVQELSRDGPRQCGCVVKGQGNTNAPATTANFVVAEAAEAVKMDRGGYFVVIPQPERSAIALEHYAYDNMLLRVIAGGDARSIYLTVIENGWVTQLSHAAYLGRELARAELSLKLGFRYVQDGA